MTEEEENMSGGMRVDPRELPVRYQEQVAATILAGIAKEPQDTEKGVKANAETITACQIETPCIICGEGIPSVGDWRTPKVCCKCKAAVMKMREEDGK